MPPLELLNMLVMALACNLLATVILTVYVAVLHRRINQVAEDLRADQRTRQEQWRQQLQASYLHGQQPAWRGEWRQ